MPTVGDKAQTLATEQELDRLARKLAGRGYKVTTNTKKGNRNGNPKGHTRNLRRVRPTAQ